MREPAGIGTSVGDAVAIYLLFSVQANLSATQALVCVTAAGTAVANKKNKQKFYSNFES